MPERGVVMSLTDSDRLQIERYIRDYVAELVTNKEIDELPRRHKFDGFPYNSTLSALYQEIEHMLTDTYLMGRKDGG